MALAKLNLILKKSKNLRFTILDRKNQPNTMHCPILIVSEGNRGSLIAYNLPSKSSWLHLGPCLLLISFEK